jgi:hypothetical protein
VRFSKHAQLPYQFFCFYFLLRSCGLCASLVFCGWANLSWSPPDVCTVAVNSFQLKPFCKRLELRDQAASNSTAAGQATRWDERTRLMLHEIRLKLDGKRARKLAS